MTTGYLVGTGEDKSADTIMRVDLNPATGGRTKGNIAPAAVMVTGGSVVVGANEDDILMKVDTDQSNTRANLAVNWSVNDTVGSLPSGLSVLGVPTYGDGRAAVATTWAADHERTVAKGELTIGRPGGPVLYDYASLSN